MRVFVFESLVAGPLDDPLEVSAAASLGSASLLAEGLAMLGALAGDLAAVGGVEVHVLVDERHAARFADAAYRVAVAANFADRGAMFDRLAATCDATIVIAPEIAGELVSLCRRVVRVGGRLIGPTAEAIELFADKHRTAEFLHRRGVPACRGVRIEAGPIDRTQLASLPFPAVVKPIDGAGSLDVRLIRCADEVQSSGAPRRLEVLAPGMAASVAALCGPNSRFMLPACSQRISDDGRFAYLGGAAPLAPLLDRRARMLAERALSTIGGLNGYVGVDLVLGGDPAGAGDVVIEINPRLTTSYIGLRRLAESNLAAALVDVAIGRPAGAPTFRAGRVTFDSDGTTRDADSLGPLA